MNNDKKAKAERQLRILKGLGYKPQVWEIEDYIKHLQRQLELMSISQGKKDNQLDLYGRDLHENE